MSEGLTVFIVDDDEAVRDSLSLLLEIEGLPTRAFVSAEAFLDAVALGDKGCLILDLRLPGMTGSELCAELARRKLSLPTLFLSGHGWSPCRDETAGRVEFVSKPVDANQLLARVRALLASADEAQRE